MRDALADPLRAVLPGQAKALSALGFQTVEDLLRHYPRRYAAPGRWTDLAGLREGEVVTVYARIAAAGQRPMRSRKGYLITTSITDDRTELEALFFAGSKGMSNAQLNHLRVGRAGLFTGKVGRDPGGRRKLVHPKFEPLTGDLDDAADEATRPVPIYPAGGKVDSAALLRAIRSALDPLAEDDVPDPLPEGVRRAEGDLPALLVALRAVHRPQAWGDWEPAFARLRFEEAFCLQVALARRRAAVAHLAARPCPPRPDGILAAFDAALPFELTPGQRAVGEEIAADLAGAAPMQRLLHGEVGAGKTVVAVRAMLQVVDAGGQAALLAPTEVLAAQHLRSITRALGTLAEGGLLGGSEIGTQVVLLTGSLGAAARRRALLAAASGEAGIVIGTHALLGEGVQFASLGLVVVDEQHRFGVEQRAALRTKAAAAPHVLVMTATPIPRTVAMTVFGDLETSTLRDLPAGRPGITTHVVPAERADWLDRVWSRAREEVDAGRRVYVVCPRISAEDPGDGADGPDSAAAPDTVPEEDGDGLPVPAGPAGDEPAATATGEGAAGERAPRDLAAVLEVSKELAQKPQLAGVRVGVLHGRLEAEEKDRTMAAFASGEVPVLVATTVIEVGVDVPEAGLMVVLDADRFGISQLHQLRGRVGRGREPGLCLLVAPQPEPGSPAAERLAALAATSDGFELALLDLRQRREGDVLGAAQSGGTSSLRLLRAVEHAEVIERARALAGALVAADPGLLGHPRLAAEVGRLLGPEREEFLDRA